MAEYSNELIQNTIEVWSPKYGYKISEDEAIEIIRNLSGFFELLLEIDRSQQEDKTLKFNDTNGLKAEGFCGFKTVEELWNDKSCIPKVKGVYLVLNPSMSSDFIYPGVGGFFKGKDPNVSIDELVSNHIDDSLVVYIGKAGSPTNKATLDSRLSQQLRFGQGKNVGHWGGRLIWQLKSHKDLVVCWRSTPEDDPRDVEKILISRFVRQFGRRPFANLTS